MADMFDAVCLCFIIISTSFVIALPTTHLNGSNTVAFKEKKFTLTCFVTSGTLTAVAFQKKNSIIGSVTYINGECKNRENGHLCTPDKCSCDGSRSFNWTIGRVPETWHNSTFTCDNVFGGSTSNVYKIYVSVPVTGVYISPDIVVGLFAGKLSSFFCQTQPASRPRAMVSWYKKSSGEADSAVMDGVSSQYITTGDFVITNSTMFYNPKPGDNGRFLYCSARTEYIHPVLSKIIQLNILYKPDSVPLVSTEPTGPYFLLNSTVHVTCQLTGGNPVVNLSWSCDSYKTDVTSIKANTNDTAILILSIIVNSSSLEGERCTCTAKHYIDSYREDAEFVLRLYQISVPPFSVTSPVTYSTQQREDEISIGAIVGVVIGGIFAVLIAVFVCMYIATMKRRKEIPALPNPFAIRLMNHRRGGHIENRQRTDQNEQGTQPSPNTHASDRNHSSSDDLENRQRMDQNEQVPQPSPNTHAIDRTENNDSHYDQITDENGHHENIRGYITAVHSENVEPNNERNQNHTREGGMIEESALNVSTNKQEQDELLVEDTHQKSGYLEPISKLASVKPEENFTW